MAFRVLIRSLFRCRRLLNPAEKKLLDLADSLSQVTAYPDLEIIAVEQRQAAAEGSGSVPAEIA